MVRCFWRSLLICFAVILCVVLIGYWCIKSHPVKITQEILDSFVEPQSIKIQMTQHGNKAVTEIQVADARRFSVTIESILRNHTIRCDTDVVAAAKDLDEVSLSIMTSEQTLGLRLFTQPDGSYGINYSLGKSRGVIDLDKIGSQLIDRLLLFTIAETTKVPK